MIEDLLPFWYSFCPNWSCSIAASRTDFGVTFSLVTKLWKRYQSSWISIKTSAFYQVRDFRNVHPSCAVIPQKCLIYIYIYVRQSYSLLPFLFAKDTDHGFRYISPMMLQSSAEFKPPDWSRSPFDRQLNPCLVLRPGRRTALCTVAWEATVSFPRCLWFVA